MSEKRKHGSGPAKSIGRYIAIGLLTAAPLAITWWILNFLFSQLARVGAPWVRGLAHGIRPQYPELADFMVNDTLLSVVAVVIVLAFLYVLGWSTSRVVGQQVIGLFESAIGRIPFVEKIYAATKKFLAVAGSTPEGERRVVLIKFPSPDMRTVGIVTRTIRDSRTGEELAVVYVPTSPNPTSGYIEIVPMRDVEFTDWSFDQAMSFIVTGGTNAPDEITYTSR
ncbi:MAG: DUF502 domain-containing protein [Rhodospirillales bacterium]